MCIRHADVYTVCCHVQQRKTEPCTVARSIKFARNCTWSILPWPLTACITRTEEHLCFSFCPRCALYFSAGGNPQTDTAIVNYWTYKNRHGFRGPVEPILVPIANIYQPVKADCTDAYLLHRLELSALAGVVHESTVRTWFDKEINKDGRTVEDWSLISALGHIRQETLAQAYARQFRQPLCSLGEASSSRIPPSTAKERRRRRASEKVKVRQGKGSPLHANHPTHIIARMEIRGNVDGLPSPFIVDVNGYRGQNHEVTGQGRVCRTGGETDLQQQDPREPRVARRTSDLFVVGDDSDDEDDLAEEAHGLDALHSNEKDAASHDDVLASPVKIASRHKPILCSIRYVPALRVSNQGRLMENDTQIVTQMPAHASVQPEIESMTTPTVATITPTGQRGQSLHPFPEKTADLPENYNDWPTSSPLASSPDGKYSIESGGRSLAVTDTFTTPGRPALNHKTNQVLPDRCLCDDDSGYDSDCNDGHLLDLPLTADKLVNLAKWKKHLMQEYGAVEVQPKIINNIKVLRPGRKAYQDYPDYTVAAWEEDTRDPASIPAVLRLAAPEVEAYDTSNGPTCMSPSIDTWEYTESVKAITKRLGVALAGKDRPLAYGLMRLPPQKRQFVMDGLVELFDSAKAVMGDLPPRTPSPSWLGRPYCLSPLPTTPVQEAEGTCQGGTGDAHYSSYRTDPRRPLPPAPEEAIMTDVEPAVEGNADNKSQASAPLRLTSGQALGVEQLIEPEDAAPSLEYQAYGHPSTSSTLLPAPNDDDQAFSEDSATILADRREHGIVPLPFTPSPELGINSQAPPTDMCSTTYFAYQPPPSGLEPLDEDVLGDAKNCFGNMQPSSPRSAEGK